MPVTLLPNRRYGRVELFLTAAHDEDVGTLFYEKLCRSQPYPGCATGNDCYFSLQLLIFGHRMSALAASSRWLRFVSKVTNTCGHAVARHQAGLAPSITKAIVAGRSPMFRQPWRVACWTTMSPAERCTVSPSSSSSH